MTLLDQFASRFNRAAKARFQQQTVDIAKVLLVSDQGPEETARLAERAQRLLRVLDGASWSTLGGEDYDSLRALSERVEAEGPDLLVTYRALKESTRDLIYSLGTYLDVLAQVLPVPVLVLPHEDEQTQLGVEEGTPQVLVMTNYLTGDDRIVNYGARFVLDAGDLFLAHIEDEQTFERYMQVIAKLPSLDSEMARKDILAQLLKEPADYAASCQEALGEAGLGITVHPLIKLGRRVSDYQALIAEHGVDLVVLEAKDERQVAMHDMTYSLAVELTRVPLLLL